MVHNETKQVRSDFSETLSLDEAAAVAKVVRRTVGRWIREGKLKAGRAAPKGRVVIRRADLMALLGLGGDQ